MHDSASTTDNGSGKEETKNINDIKAKTKGTIYTLRFSQTVLNSFPQGRD